MDATAAIAIVGVGQFAVLCGLYVRMGRLIERVNEHGRRLARLEFERG